MKNSLFHYFEGRLVHRNSVAFVASTVEGFSTISEYTILEFYWTTIKMTFSIEICNKIFTLVARNLKKWHMITFRVCLRFVDLRRRIDKPLLTRGSSCLSKIWTESTPSRIDAMHTTIWRRGQISPPPPGWEENIWFLSLANFDKIETFQTKSQVFHIVK